MRPIRLAAYGEDAPQLTSGREAEPPTRSVVVNRSDEASDGFRAAQLPPPENANTGSTKDPSGSGNPSIEDDLRSPFVDNPAEPPQPNPLAMPASNTDPALPPPREQSGENAARSQFAAVEPRATAAGR